MEALRRSIPISAAIVVIGGVSWLGLRYFRSQIDCKKLDAAFARQVENIKEDAHKRLKIGTKKADVARFFAELSISLTISGSEARGTLWTSGCADRKSTRLNSSHMSSSYAVFCLKKKMY